MIVDCHTHISSAGDEISLAGHPAATETDTVDVCIVLAAADKSSQETNKALSEYVSKYEEKTIGFALVEPTRDNISIKNLSVLAEKMGLVGTVLYCSEFGFHPAHSRAMRFYESAEELGLPVFFHNDFGSISGAVLDYAQPYLLDEVARTFPKLKIVVGTMGVPFVEQTLSMAAKHKNVYADLTVNPSRVWQIYNMVVAAYEQGVMDKLLFGSGYPEGKAEECIETLLGFNKLLGDTNLPAVPRGSIRNIIERNTLELLGIKKDLVKPERKEISSNA